MTFVVQKHPLLTTTIPRLSNSLKVFSATANCSGERRRARAAMGGQVVWIEWVV